tara:strand:- start:133 stop:1761 length:1629 start_codon:yes stop_codon:yes gene_type:complete
MMPIFKSIITVLFFITIGVKSLLGFDVSDLPVQDEGRIKPLDTFARNHLLAFYGKRTLKESNLSATDWLINSILDPKKARDQKIFNISNPEVVSSLFLQWTTEHKYSYNEIVPGLQNQTELIKSVEEKDNKIRTNFEKQLLQLSNNIFRYEGITTLRDIKLIPPGHSDNSGEWLDPFRLIVSGSMVDEKQEKILNSLQSYLGSRLLGKETEMATALDHYHETLKSYSRINVDLDVLEMETWMNKNDLFLNSLVFYLISFLLLMLSWIIKPKVLKKLSFLSLNIGFMFHGLGICMRMYIMGRPPVTTLYESVIFVSIIITILAIFLEYFRKDGLGIFVGSVSGAVLHFVGFSYASDGDTLGMLVAVLNSNFWLATHVTTITMGYGASLMAGCIGHLYLIQSLRFGSNSKNLKSIFKNLFGITLIALFFTLFGTILGGIWADQSWGRFWGWDPKENGALLIVLWQLMMIHMRLSGIVKPSEFALGMALNNIIVALAWFGVNLLQVGLHSYGFDDGVARNLFIFIAFEIIFCVGIYFYPRLRLRL